MTAHLRAAWRRRIEAAVYTVDVDWSTDKDTLKAGELVSGTSRVRVEADTDAEAILVAQQMVAPREPTAFRLVL